MHIQERVPRSLCLRDATPVEWVHLIHLHRQEWGKRRMLGPYSIQHAVCLHMACKGNYNDSQMHAFEEIAKSEDATALLSISSSEAPTSSQPHLRSHSVVDRASHPDMLSSHTQLHKHIHCDAFVARSSTSGSQDSQVVM